jgi:hypothetical protein
VAAGLVLTLPHFLKNIIFYHNPIYPFAQDFFTASWPAQPSSARMVRGMLTDALGLPRGTLGDKFLEAVRVFFTFSFKAHYAAVGSAVVGSLFTLLLPLALLVRRARRIWIGIASVFVAMLVWGMTQYAERYLQILTPLMAAVVAALLVRGWQLGWIMRIGLVPLVLLQVVAGGDMIFSNAGPRIQSGIELIRSGSQGVRDDASRFKYRQSEQKLGAALPPDAVLLLHSTVMNLGIDRQVLTDVVGKQGLLDYDQIGNPVALWELYRSVGITHVAHLVGVPATFNRAHDVLFIDFAHRVATERRRFGAWELVTVPDRAKAPPARYQVVCLGINYRSGLYGIEQLRVHENQQPAPPPLPRPRIPWPDGDAERAALLGQAEAVLVGTRHQLAPAVAEALSRDFKQAVTYPSKYVIWLRR